MPQDDLYVIVKPPINIPPTVSYHYMKWYVNESGRNVTLRVGRRLWLVKLLFYKKNSFCRFSSGWLEFMRDCDLKVGDTCICKMIDEENLEFEVSFLKGKKFRDSPVNGNQLSQNVIDITGEI
ncbi:hypothetical protein Fmac_001919 [Flemingia macrophylla]|uniref:TF-B3 domain-containing protein n=1 Tax=Flemingia macrophylla TaxID=520843 RepID=A0ABD1NIG9_9FABA